MSIPSTVGRVPLHTASVINAQIARQTERNIRYYASNPDQIGARLKELDHEWDIERTLEVNAGAMSLASVVFGTLISRKLLFMPAVVGALLLRHAVSGGSFSLSFYRRMGVRTQAEIERERYALKALRGDFRQVTQEEDAPKPKAEILKLVIKAVDE